jgi:hypothetical protein
MSSFEKSQMKKKRTRRKMTATRKMMMGTKATRSEHPLAVAKSQFHQLSGTEGTAQANCNDQDATEDHHEVTDAK